MAPQTANEIVEYHQTNAYPTELAWHVVVSLRRLDLYIFMLYWF